MLRFGEQGELLELLFNHECPEKESEAIEAQLRVLCEENGLTLTRKGTYELTQGNSQNLSIKFFRKLGHYHSNSIKLFFDAFLRTGRGLHPRPVAFLPAKITISFHTPSFA